MTVIIDYGMGNLYSVAKAGAFLGRSLQFTDSQEVIEKAGRIILPGVAHFGHTVKELKRRKLFGLLKERIARGTPFLGICVGMQLLMEESEEAKGVKGLGIIKGKVKKFKGKNLIVPHMGWNVVRVQKPEYPSGILRAGRNQKAEGGRQKTEDRSQKSGVRCQKRRGRGGIDLFKGVKREGYFYFANSYYCKPQSKKVVLASTCYGLEFAAAVHKDNVWGVQFHPEKSQRLGLKVLDNFLKA